MTTPQFIFESDFANLRKIATKTPPPNYVGEWCTVDFQPHELIPQQFTVGVVVQIPNDRLHFKLLDDFKKFQGIYNDQLPQRIIREIVAHAEETLRNAAQSRTPIREIVFETSSLSLSTALHTSGHDCESDVERLFAEIVVMAIKSSVKVNDFETIDTHRARLLVNEELKRIAHLDYERIVNPDSQGLLLNENGSVHYLDISLITPRACGSVTSAVYRSAQTVELNLLKSSRDLTTYSRIRKLNNVGLFLLLPSAGAMEAKDFHRIEDLIGEQEWKLERDGFRVVSHASPLHLAEEIYAWARPTI